MKEYKLYKKCNISWLDSIPDHWKTKPAKRLFTLLRRPVGPQDEIITCFRDGVVTLRKNRRETGFTESLKETGYQGIKKGDLVIHQMDAFAGSVGVSDSDGKSTPVYSVCAPKEKLSPYYYAYIIREMARSNYILALAKGIRQRSTDFKFSTFAQCILPAPPVGEQDIIVAYLDKKCAEIDELISRRHAIIERLKELKQSIIVSAVTRGLDPDVPMKDSGIPWLGEIPTHWKTQKFTSKFRLGKGLSITKADLRESGARVINYGQIHSRMNNGVDVNNVGICYVDSCNIEAFPKALVHSNDILFADTSEDIKGIGNCVRISCNTVFFAGYHIIIAFNKVKGNTKYEAYLFQSENWRNQLRMKSNGVKVFSISKKNLRQCYLINPPEGEKEQIVTYLDNKCAEIDALVARQEQIIEKLKELKVSTIAHVVTGKVDVRDAI